VVGAQEAALRWETFLVPCLRAEPRGAIRAQGKPEVPGTAVGRGTAGEASAVGSLPASAGTQPLRSPVGMETALKSPDRKLKTPGRICPNLSLSVREKQLLLVLRRPSSPHQDKFSIALFHSEPELIFFLPFQFPWSVQRQRCRGHTGLLRPVRGRLVPMPGTAGGCSSPSLTSTGTACAWWVAPGMRRRPRPARPPGGPAPAEPWPWPSGLPSASCTSDLPESHTPLRKPCGQTPKSASSLPWILELPERESTRRSLTRD